MMNNFEDICKMEQKDLKEALYKELILRGYVNVVNEDGFIYAEGSFPVMVVAHMDTVHHDKCSIVCKSEDGKYIMSPQGIGGDDRCGIYMALKIIEEFGCHVLFTEDEEIGCVGARKFAASNYKPDIKYIIEFDRKGKDDAVFYSCDNPDFTTFITDPEVGFKEASGSCSDISHVAPALGVAAVNLSCGYYNAHTCHEYVNTVQMENNIERAKLLLKKPSDKFKYIEKVYYRPSISTYHSTGNHGSGYYTSGYNPKHGGYTGYDSYYGRGCSYYGSDDYDDGKVQYDLPEPTFELDDIIEYGLGILNLKDHCKLKTSDGKMWTPSNDCIVDEAGRVYLLNEDTQIYYPLISDIGIVDCDGNPLVYEPIDEEEFAFGYLENLKKISQYADSLVEFDLKNGTDFESDFWEEVYSRSYGNNYSGYSGR